MRPPTKGLAQRSDEFSRRVADIGARHHSQKRQLIARLMKTGILAG
jgi:hypothetical protein